MIMLTMNYENLLEDIYDEVTPLFGQGQVATYIPELSKVRGNQFGMALCTNDGIEYLIGCSEKNLSIQSVSKTFTFALAYKIYGEELWGRLGLEPSGSKFNSLILLEKEKGIPRNPFINAGSLVICDMLIEALDDPLGEILKFLKELSGNPNLYIDERVRDSELRYGNVNYALSYFMKSYGNIRTDVQTLMMLYCSQCAIEMSCTDLARSYRLFSQNGLNPWNLEPVLTPTQAKRVNAIMMTCGLYNGVGDFAYRVGIPAKSGVGGAIVGAIPGEMSVAVWSPELDINGNSLAGLKALEIFTTRTGLSIY